DRCPRRARAAIREGSTLFAAPPSSAAKCSSTSSASARRAGSPPAPSRRPRGPPRAPAPPPPSPARPPRAPARPPPRLAARPLAPVERLAARDRHAAPLVVADLARLQPISPADERLPRRAARRGQHLDRPRRAVGRDLRASHLVRGLVRRARPAAQERL